MANDPRDMNENPQKKKKTGQPAKPAASQKAPSKQAKPVSASKPAKPPASKPASAAPAKPLKSAPPKTAPVKQENPAMAKAMKPVDGKPGRSKSSNSKPNPASKKANTPRQIKPAAMVNGRPKGQDAEAHGTEPAYVEQIATKVEESELRVDVYHQSWNRMFWRFGRKVIVFLVSLAIVIFGVFLIYDYVDKNYLQPVDANDARLVPVEIERGASLSKIAQELYEHDLVRNEMVFKLYIDFTDRASKLRAGDYVFTRQMDMDTICEILMMGSSNKDTVMVTLNEGYTVPDIAQKLVDAGVLANSKRFLELANDYDEFGDSYISLVNEETSGDRRYLLEGYLFPDSYEFFYNTSEEIIIGRLLARFGVQFTDEYFQRAEELGMTVDEVVTLASIIEKEARSQDFKKVSAVFHNRLNNGARLESCATVHYFSGLKRLHLTKADQELESPYNTYKYTGLPPGPICNPGQQAIEAVLYPDEQFREEGYFFFCSKDPYEGELAFAITNEEHEANVELYQSLWDAYDQENGYSAPR